MRWMSVAIALLLSPPSPARAQVSVGINIGIDVPVFPELVPVPGYPVYYAPSASANYFFYDGLYWVFVRDGWYASSWYDGPWHLVGPEYVPVYLLRVPVRYYRVPPPYFHAWRPDAPPRWGERYGPAWERRRAGWNRWDRRAAPRAAPLPLYQRRYAGDRYPRSFEQQRAIRSERYRYRPREAIAREQYQRPGDRGGARYEPQRRGPERGPAEPSRGGAYRQQGWREQGPPQRMREQPMREQQPTRELGRPQQLRQQPASRPEPAPLQRGRGPEAQDPRRGGGPAPGGGGRDDRGEERGPGRR